MRLFSKSPDDQSPAQLFLSNLGLIKDIAFFVCRAHGVKGAEAEDFESDVKLKLIEDNYAVFRKFASRCSLKSYLNTVITRFFIDQKVRTGGRWRPSEQAKRLGNHAIKLEELLHKDRYSFEEACNILKMNRGVELSMEQLHDIALQLPKRQVRLQKEDTETAIDLTAGRNPEGSERVVHQQSQSVKTKVNEILNSYYAKLESEDRLVLKMHFESNFKVSEISRSLDINQKTLYWRIEKMLQGLKAEILSSGLTEEQVMDAIRYFDSEISIDFTVQRLENQKHVRHR